MYIMLNNAVALNLHIKGVKTLCATTLTVNPTNAELLNLQRHA